MIKKILIANRGEIAIRVIRSCKEMDIQTVSVHSIADRNSLHRFLSDEDVCIGESASIDSYLNIPKIIGAAEITEADAIHPGYGFLSESEDFAKACKDNNITFIGPSPHSIRMMGNKSKARETMKKSGVPILPGTGVLKDAQEAIDKAKKIGFPIILKACSGGGGRGMKICHSKEEVEKSYNIATNEAKIAFNDGDMYMEKYIEEPHHIEVQILADKHKNVVHLGERECSIQRKHQKLIEETPSPFISEKMRKKLRETAVKGVANIGYEGAGTLEFLVDHEMNFYFMEMNTRIQVEHTVSEMYTNIDLIKAQIDVANGLPLPFSQKDINFNGHSIECRINAEDPANNFIPCPGELINFHIPQGLGVRVDTHCYNNYVIPPTYDSMIAKLIIWGSTREEAIQRTKRALNEFYIEGIKTTLPFHSFVMNNKQFRKGKYSTNFLNEIDMNQL